VLGTAPQEELRETEEESEETFKEKKQAIRYFGINSNNFATSRNTKSHC
jgi:hypothetical protein